MGIAIGKGSELWVSEDLKIILTDTRNGSVDLFWGFPE
jgi:hypothetical protein